MSCYSFEDFSFSSPILARLDHEHSLAARHSSCQIKHNFASLYANLARGNYLHMPMLLGDPN